MTGFLDVVDSVGCCRFGCRENAGVEDLDIVDVGIVDLDEVVAGVVDLDAVGPDSVDVAVVELDTEDMHSDGW